MINLTDIKIPLTTDFPKCKNNLINYFGEQFEVIMGELLNSVSRNFGSGLMPADAKRMKTFIDESILPFIPIPAQDTPVLAATDDTDEDVKPSS